jgi:hypothetical protein
MSSHMNYQSSSHGGHTPITADEFESRLNDAFGELYSRLDQAFRGAIHAPGSLKLILRAFHIRSADHIN